jgi:hypothetical protein
MSQVTAKYQDVSNVQRNWCPLVLIGPPLANSSALSKVDGHLVGSGDNLEAAICEAGGVNGNVCRNVFNAVLGDLTIDVVVGGGIEVRSEAVAAGELVVDLVLEEEHFLTGEAMSMKTTVLCLHISMVVMAKALNAERRTHIPAELGQYPPQILAAQESLQSLMVVHKLLRSHDLPNASLRLARRKGRE